MKQRNWNLIGCGLLGLVIGVLLTRIAAMPSEQRARDIMDELVADQADRQEAADQSDLEELVLASDLRVLICERARDAAERASEPGARDHLEKLLDLYQELGSAPLCDELVTLELLVSYAEARAHYDLASVIYEEIRVPRPDALRLVTQPTVAEITSRLGVEPTKTPEGRFSWFVGGYGGYGQGGRSGRLTVSVEFDQGEYSRVINAVWTDYY